MIGKIVSIKDSHIYVSLSINIYNMENLIGKNITFDNRYIGEVVNLSNTLLEAILIGEINNGVFVTGNLSMPSFSSGCRFTSLEELNIIYAVNNNINTIKLGQSYVYKNFPVFVNVNSFFANHFAVLGNSGAGKSWFLARLLQGIFYDAKRLPYNANIFLFDAYGEYESAFYLQMI